MNDEERVLRCAYEDSALWELAAELDTGAAAAIVRALVDRGLVYLYVEGGWPRLAREPLDPSDVAEALAREENWTAPRLEGSDVRALHARTVGIAITEEGLQALRSSSR